MKTRGFAWPLVALLGCRAESTEPEEDVDVASEGGDGQDERVRFYEDVAPILATACNGCHKEGGVAPFALDTYEDALSWAEAIAVVTEARTMPPFNINNDGSCNEFTDARWLDDEQIATLRTWVEDGTPEGDATLGMPQAPPPTERRGERIVALQTPADYTPAPQNIEAAMFDDYQCFLVDPELGEDAFLVGFDVVPGDDRVVHHVLGFNVDPTRMVNGQSNADLMAELDAADDRPGWDCYAAAGDGVWIEGVPVTWAPGAGATHYPEGTGIRIGAGQQLVVQMHYSLIDAEAAADGTEIRLALADEVEREGTMVLVDGFLMSLLTGAASLPPGEEKATFAWDV